MPDHEKRAEQARRRAEGLAAIESGKSLGLRGGSEIWLMKSTVEDGGADLKHVEEQSRPRSCVTRLSNGS